MIKTSLYLPAELKQSIERAAQERGVSEAQFIRDALAAAAYERPVRWWGVIASEGRPRDDASRVDEILAETGFGEC